MPQLAELLEAARPYVCARVTNMAEVDLEVFRFDYDLTFATLLTLVVVRMR